MPIDKLPRKPKIEQIKVRVKIVPGSSTTAQQIAWRKLWITLLGELQLDKKVEGKDNERENK